jgi:hypothetical protein
MKMMLRDTTTVLLALGLAGLSTEAMAEALLQQRIEETDESLWCRQFILCVGECGSVCRVFVQLYSFGKIRMERQSVIGLSVAPQWYCQVGLVGGLFPQQTFLPV